MGGARISPALTFFFLKSVCAQDTQPKRNRKGMKISPIPLSTLCLNQSAPPPEMLPPVCSSLSTCHACCCSLKVVGENGAFVQTRTPMCPPLPHEKFIIKRVCRCNKLSRKLYQASNHSLVCFQGGLDTGPRSYPQADPYGGNGHQPTGAISARPCGFWGRHWSAGSV